MTNETKPQTLTLNKEFKHAYYQGKSKATPFFVCYMVRGQAGKVRYGITTSKKIGNAVKRNRARRRIRELYRTNEARLAPGYDIVVVARTRVIYGRYRDLERSFLQLMRKLELVRPQEGAKSEPK